MKNTRFTISVSTHIGKVHAISMVPSDAVAIMVLGHGAGAGMEHPFMESLAIALGEKKIGTVRYNFPYMDKEKRGRPDPPAIAEKTVAQVILTAQDKFPSLPVFAGGKSFGGRMTSQRLSKESGPVAGIVFYGFPLHAPGKPGTDRAAHLHDITIPMLFLQGTRDALASIGLIKKVCTQLPTATLVEFEGADHSFKAGKQNLIPDLALQTALWIKSTLKQVLL